MLHNLIIEYVLILLHKKTTKNKMLKLVTVALDMTIVSCITIRQGNVGVKRTIEKIEGDMSCNIYKISTGKHKSY